MDISLLENPSYKGWKKLAEKLPYDFRQRLKNTDYPPLIDFVKWLLIDLQRPRYFHPYGLYFYVGLPGTGKTIYMSYELNKFRRKYGNKIYIGTNYGFKGEDFEVNGYEDIIKVRDKPTIIGYDEIQNDFDARNWANLDQAFSERITQSRKMEGLMILATAQKFGFVDKRLRELTHLVFQCKTIFNRLTFAKIYEPKIVDKLEEGLYTEYNESKSKGFKYFVQSDKIRSLYNSYQILQKVADRLQEYTQSSDKTLAEISDLLSKTTAYGGANASPSPSPRRTIRGS